MPEINHKAQPPVPPVSALAGEARKAAEAASGSGVDPNTVAPPPLTAKNLAEVIAASMTPEQLEEQVERVLLKKRKEALEAAKPKEPDWSKVTDRDIANMELHIPVIEHEVPDYMNIKLKDSEYEVVWVNRDQRRYGQLLAEGYEPLRKEHVDPNFKLPLKFASDGDYIYQDVIAMRVHKRILYSKRRLALQRSQNQLRRKGADDRIKAKLAEMIEGDPALTLAFQRQGFGFYDTDVV